MGPNERYPEAHCIGSVDLGFAAFFIPSMILEKASTMQAGYVRAAPSFSVLGEWEILIR